MLARTRLKVMEGRVAMHLRMLLLARHRSTVTGNVALKVLDRLIQARAPRRMDEGRT